MVERTERDEKWIVDGLANVITCNLNFARDIMMAQKTHPYVGKIASELKDIGLDINRYQKEGIEFSEDFIDKYSTGCERIERYIEGCDVSEEFTDPSPDLSGLMIAGGCF